ncbi:hypothetical protein H920_09999 [Fukomys damarensis]|uniref:Uncharacterized protein n=1 Tax=Fukomys damarensis TaxID=885580 RepID=A0A091DEB2_FUKDA|nr:hypothetical protein H920_09999 [Fukomys damarensis]
MKITPGTMVRGIPKIAAMLFVYNIQDYESEDQRMNFSRKRKRALKPKTSKLCVCVYAPKSKEAAEVRVAYLKGKVNRYKETLKYAIAGFQDSSVTQLNCCSEVPIESPSQLFGFDPIFRRPSKITS